MSVAVVAALAAGCAGTSSPATHSAPPGPTRADRAMHYLQANYRVQANYRGTSWLPHVRRVRGYLGQLWVTTTLPEGASAARDVCAAVSSFELAHGGFTGVRVASVDGQRLAWRQNLGDPC